MPKYGIAHDVVGFRADPISIRVRILRDAGSHWNVRTADLVDAGTLLVLDKSRVQLSYRSEFSGEEIPVQ